MSAESGLADLRVLRHGPPQALLARREPGDDFYCVRYRIWYPSFDCAIRTRYRTSQGCLDCEQGRFNLKRHRDAVDRARTVVYRGA